MVDDILQSFFKNGDTYGAYEYDLYAKIFAAVQVLVYLCLSAALVLMFVHAKKTEIIPEISKNHPSKFMADKLMFGQFIFLQLSLVCKLICMVLLVFIFEGYIQDDDIPQAIGKIFYCTSWSFLYLAFNCDMYKWVFAVDRVKLYGSEINVAQFRYRQRLSYCFFVIVATILVLVNLVMTFYSAFEPDNMKSVMFQSLIIFDYGSLWITFLVVGAFLIFYLPYYFGRNFKKQKDCLLKVVPLNLFAISTIIVRNALSI